MDKQSQALYALLGIWFVLIGLHAWGLNDTVTTALGGATAALFGYLVHVLSVNPAS